ncbi:UbiD family decarboxylase [Fimbriiglobus ruber]|uniref:3-polyprenyl-4-hydroxybenzoate carboxy-lyase n=1 Tax=Fimbriiglobus ruber TaxID=1908690 RepID=A0A225DGK6_9BACT|nr:UbiD family decarboxylase [Fimbriiglobus ruber]OWK36309.1 3-polyprenyl-4-hydroxybenzoate carboxy-lyase [Fimbriiglobus ruber]
MGHLNLTEAVTDLERHGHLVRIDAPVDPHLEMAEIQRRLYRRGGPAVLFTRPTGTTFPMLCNLFGTIERTRFLFRDALSSVRKLVALKTDPGAALKHPWRYWDAPLAAWRARPKFVRSGPILAHTTTTSRLPQLKCWPQDGGAFVTLPQVYTEHPDRPGWAHSNLGMYRVQLSGNEYEPDREVGMHYQIHRGIGVHHAAAVARGERLRVNVVVGGPPALAVSAVMPLPEGVPELAFAGALGGRRLRMVYPRGGQLPVPAEADFVIAGTIDPTRTKPEGPFGDHLGYYSLTHPFPVMTVEAVYHRPGAIWPFTVVGRPPQEDTSFGEFIHELTGPVIPTVLPGVHAVHAVDAAGVHPLLLAIGSERYVPYAETRRPQELLTLASAILGQGQLSLAKYLLIVAREDDPTLDVHDVPAVFRHVLERVDWARDLHFHTRTTIDTLDYSAGEGLNAGSKVVIAVAGPKRRELGKQVPANLSLPAGFTDPRVALSGVLVVRGPGFGAATVAEYHPDLVRFVGEFGLRNPNLGLFPLIVIVDENEFAARSLNNWLWVTFTRSNPAADILGVDGATHRKHYGCRGPLVIDARLKPHMAPPLEEAPAVSKRVDEMCAAGGPLHGLID